MQLQASDNRFEAKNMDHILDLDGFSDDLLRTHVNLYNGYVDATNNAHDMLRAGGLDANVRAELRRRFVWEFNGMRLHELYFDALSPGGRPLDADGDLVAGITKEFGSTAAWLEDLRSVATMRGVGWAATVRDPVTGRLFNQWIDEHDAGALATTDPLLLIDVFEHAFIRDFGTDRDAYLDALFDNVNFDVVEKRYASSLTG